MSTIDIAALARDPKGTVFDTQPSNKSLHPREVVYENLASDYNSLSDEEPKGKMYEVKDDDAVFNLRYGNESIPLKETGRKKSVFPADMLPDVVAKVMDDVKAGAYDDKLEAMQKQYSGRLKAAAAARKANAAQAAQAAAATA
uniref:Uncharacterized protein n=1 Tax=viral metagenome TaxID=1070528 RepID=A0A6M3Y1G4_9ZZZZ